MKNRLGSLIGSFALGALVIGFIAGCGGSKETQVALKYVWPELPDSPRVAYIQTFRGEMDFSSGLSGFVSDLAGSEKTPVGFGRPFDVCVAANGRIYVTDPAAGVIMYDTKERRAEQLGSKSSVSLEDPRGIAYARGQLFVGLAKSKKIVVLDDEGQVIRAIGREGRFPNPVDIVCDTPRHRIYVVDIKLHEVTAFTETGESLFTVGGRGESDGFFNFPQSAAVDKDGNLYVVDGFNFRIEIFDSTGKFLRKFGSQGDVFGTFARPKGIALDSHNNIYVLDALHQNYQIFNNAGELLMFVGKYSPLNDGFANPVSIAIDAENRIYVTDNLNARVQVFQLLKGD